MGIAKSNLFDPYDLHARRNMPAVRILVMHTLVYCEQCIRYLFVKLKFYVKFQLHRIPNGRVLR